MSQYYVLNFIIQRRPGVSELELARAIHGEKGEPLQVYADCVGLVCNNRVERRGTGSASDPYRYWPVVRGPRLPRIRKGKHRRRRFNALARAVMNDCPVLYATRFEIRHPRGIEAEAVQQGAYFIVLAGSEALKDAGYSEPHQYGPLKQKLIAQRVLVPSRDGTRYEFAQPYWFTSRTAAAAVVLDRNADGRHEWRPKPAWRPEDAADPGGEGASS